MRTEEPKENTWYRAFDSYGGEEWFNYFFSIKPRKQARYLSIGPLSDPTNYNVELMDEPYDRFKEDILDFFEFEEEVPSDEEARLIIKGTFN